MRIAFQFVLFFLCFLTAHAGTVHIGLASNFSELSTVSFNPYGGYFRNGVKLALAHNSSRLKEKGINLQLQEFDYGANDLNVRKIVKDAEKSGVSAVIGYNYSSNALMAAPLHSKLKLPMLSPSASANRLGNEVTKKKRGRRRKDEPVEQANPKDQNKFFVDVSKDPESKELVLNFLAQANNKEHGREISFKDLVFAALPKLTQKDIEKIQESCLSEMEKVERALTEYNKKNDTKLTLGEFLVRKLGIN